MGEREGGTERVEGERKRERERVREGYREGGREEEMEGV